MFKKLLLVLLLMFPTIQARELPKNPNYDYVYDETGIVTEETKTFVDELNEQLASTGAEVVVAVIPTLDGQDIESFANELFRDWGIADKIKNNGILLLVAIDDRLMRIEVGYGLEGAIPDSVAGRIIRTYLQPNFKEEKYNEGIQEAVQAICEYIAIEYNISLNGKTPEDYAKLDSELQTLVNVVVEAYPELQANENFLALQDELAGTENRIAVARKDYNESVTKYNKYIRSFPNNILAGMFGFETRDLFEATSSDAPVVEF